MTAEIRMSSDNSERMSLACSTIPIADRRDLSSNTTIVASKANCPMNSQKVRGHHGACTLRKESREERDLSSVFAMLVRGGAPDGEVASEGHGAAGDGYLELDPGYLARSGASL